MTVTASEETLPPGPSTARGKIGLDANRPIDPKSGAIQAQVADPDVIASTGAGWVRLNFLLGPWSGPGDTALHEGRTWAQAYGQIISGFRARGLNVYGLIGCEAVPDDPGDRFRAPPRHGEQEDEWLERYVDHFVAIVQAFYPDVPIVESFNEPDDWHGQKRPWIHPAWFAVMLQRLYSAVRSKPELEGVKLVSGPLQGLQANNNAAALYLHDTYRAGKAWFGWGQPGIPFPFDGVGYHLYLKHSSRPDPTSQERAVRATYRRYLSEMQQVIVQEEGQEKPLYVSEMGWSSAVDYREVQRWELFQAHLLRVSLETVSADPRVALGCWFCTQDFGGAARGSNFGLYRAGEPVPENRKAAFHTFKALCEGVPAEPPAEGRDRRFTNQEIIDAFYRAAVELGLPGRWSLLAKAGLSLAELAADRYALYAGPPPDQLPNLTAAEKQAVLDELDRLASAAQPSPLALAVAPAGWSGAAMTPLDEAPGDELPLALQGQIVTELKENRDLLERLLAEAARPQPQGIELRRLLPALLAAALAIAFVAALLGALLMRVLLP